MPVTLIKSKWVNGSLVFYDVASGNNICTINPGANGLSLVGATVKGQRFTVQTPPIGAAATNGYPVWVAPANCKVISAQEVHSVAGGAGMSINIEKLPSGNAAGSGASVLASAFDVTGNANTPLSKNASSNNAAVNLVAGDRLGMTSANNATYANGYVALLMEWT